MRHLFIASAFIFFIAATISTGDVLARGGNEVASAPSVTNYAEVLNSFEYPKKCKRRDIEGQVTMRLLVSKTGEVLKVQVLSTGNEKLSEACLKHMEKFTFEPARNAEGEAVASWVKMPIKFKLH